MTIRHGGKILADALVEHGAKFAFGVPGESYLPVLDGLHDQRHRLQFVSCRHEGGASYMAEAYGKLTGEPGVLLVTRGPGATNGSVGVHTAFQDSTPMVVFIGQVGNNFVEREAFQEIDYRRMFGQMTKWVAQIDRVERIPEYVSRAFSTAMSGRRGPVVLALPEDVLFAEAAVADMPHYVVASAAPPPLDIAALGKLLERACKPFVLLGGGGWDARTCDSLADWIEAAELPVGTAFRCQDLYDNRRPNYAGDVGIGINPKLAQRLRDSDLVIAIGARLDEMTTSGYTLLEAPLPHQPLVHVLPAAEQLGAVYRATLPIVSAMSTFVDSLAQLQVDGARWHDWTHTAHHDYLKWIDPQPVPGNLQLAEIVHWLDRTLPDDAIVTCGAGNFTGWVHRYFRFRKFRSQLGPTNGSMGYGWPAAIAAKLAAPSRMVVAICGDGDFLMNGQDMATAVQYDVSVICIVVNNGMYGTIRMHQERK